jgi:hypothetical protein
MEMHFCVYIIFYDDTGFFVSRPIAYAIMKKYPTVVQIVMGA